MTVIAILSGALSGGMAVILLSLFRLPEVRSAPLTSRLYQVLIAALFAAAALGAAAVLVDQPWAQVVAGAVLLAVLLGWWALMLAAWRSIADGSATREYVAAMSAAVAIPEAEPEHQPIPVPASTVGLDAVMEAYQARSLSHRDLERAGCVMWVCSQDGSILYSRGAGLPRYGLAADGSEIVGTSMDDWPNSEAWRAAVAALTGSAAPATVVQDLPDWLVPSRVAYALLPDGNVVGVCIPAPTKADLSIWPGAGG